MALASIRLELARPFDEVLARLPDLLKAEGFGILTEVDVRKTLDEKLGVPFRRYRILGACNPPFAHEALQIDLGAGLAMPCNVVVYEGDDGGTVVLAVDPMATVAALGNPDLERLATDVRDRLRRALGRLDTQAAETGRSGGHRAGVGQNLP